MRTRIDDSYRLTLTLILDKGDFPNIILLLFSRRRFGVA